MGRLQQNYLSAIVPALALIASVAAPPAVAATGSATKTIISRPVEGTQASQKLQLLVTATQREYRANEPIRFRVAGNEEFYLYVYSLHSNGNRATLILAPARTKDRYHAGRMYDIPGAGREFVAPKPGFEHVVFVASRKFVALEAARSGSAFPTISEKALEQAFAQKGLVVRSSAPDPNIDVQRLVVKVIADANERTHPVHGRYASARNTVMPFVAVDRMQYRVGEPVRVLFGATKTGYVHLFVVEPDGSVSSWLTERVLAKKVYIRRTHAERPIGSQALIAAFTTDRYTTPDVSQVASSAVMSPAGGPNAKGLAPPETSNVPVAVYRFTIR